VVVSRLGKAKYGPLLLLPWGGASIFLVLVQY